MGRTWLRPCAREIPFLSQLFPRPTLTYLNIHTHSQPPEGEQTIASFGLHPWHLNEEWPDQLKAVEKQIDQHIKSSSLPTAAFFPDLQAAAPSQPLPFFIGECGLDRLCPTPYDIQLDAFKAQIRLSEQLSRPLILHCVKAIDDVLQLKKGTRQPWIWHGFRGKPQQLLQLLNHGFYVSFGLHFNEASISQCPLERLFLETDDAPQSIVPLYEAVARRRFIAITTLQTQMWRNLKAVACR